ncbi:MAG: hypothetical protein WA517_04810 [Candidatus Acidiferrum sp.]
MAAVDLHAEKQPEYTVSLTGNQLSIAMFGIVEFLRLRLAYRVIAAVLGVAVVLASAASLSGLKFMFADWFGVFSLIIVAPWFFWAATVSGPRFRLVIATEKAQEERREAEKQFETSRAPEDALKVDLARLNEYYVMNQTQARSSFRWAKFAMLVGFATIVGGIWLFYFHSVQPDKFMAAISTAAGCVVNLVSGLFFYLYSKTQERSFLYYEQLSELQKMYVAIRLLDSHTNIEKQTEARDLVIRELLRSRKIGDSRA